MSIRVMTAVFDHSESAGNDRLILLIIADRSHDDGTGCWRGRESIARMARVHPNTVTNSIRHLEELGELVVDRRPGTTSEYRIVLPGVSQDLGGGLTTGAQTPSQPVVRDTSFRRPYPNAQNASQEGPVRTHLSRDANAAPLWETDENGDARWIGPGPAPTPANKTWS